MIAPSQSAPPVPGLAPDRPTLVVFFETDCPTCQLALPYLNKLGAGVIGISQDDDAATREFVRQMGIAFPVQLDPGLMITRAYDPQSVPTIFLVGGDGQVQRALVGFDKAGLNELAAALGHPPIASEHDGAPPWKPGCSSRHLEPESAGPDAGSALLLRTMAEPATRISVPDGDDPFAFCMEHFGGVLPVIPPAEGRVQKMLTVCGLPPLNLQPREIVARVPPVYGEATVEKIAANAVMAGCAPEMIRILVPLVRALCDERFNLHGGQATTHVAAPLVIVNGPMRNSLVLCSKQKFFSCV